MARAGHNSLFQVHLMTAEDETKVDLKKSFQVVLTTPHQNITLTVNHESTTDKLISTTNILESKKFHTCPFIMGGGLISRVIVTTVLTRGMLLSSWLNTTRKPYISTLKAMKGDCKEGSEESIVQDGYGGNTDCNSNHTDEHGENVEYLQIATESSYIRLKSTPLATCYSTESNNHVENDIHVKNYNIKSKRTKKNKIKNDKSISDKKKMIESVSWTTQIIPKTFCDILNPDENTNIRKERTLLPLKMLFNNSQKYIYENSIHTDDNFSLFECQKRLLLSLLKSDFHNETLTNINDNVNITKKIAYNELYQIIDSLQSLLKLRLYTESLEQLRAVNSKWMVAFPKVRHEHHFVFHTICT
jgi:hypothetical protein